jgi:hypothetical protein
VSEQIEQAVSPTPRPLKAKPTPEDVVAKHNEAMREKAKELYAALLQGDVPITSGNPEVVVWMRARGVRIKAQMTTSGSFYHLVDKPAETPVEPEKEGTLSPLRSSSDE